MVCHLKHSLARDVATVQDILEEGPCVVHAFGPAEGDDQQGIVSVAHLALISWTMSTSAITLSTGVSGRMPCPRLKMWPGRPPAWSRMCLACARSVSWFANSETGSRFPITPTS